MTRHRRAYTLPEVLLLLALLALFAMIAVPVGSNALERRRLQAAARHMATLCRQARLKAALHSTYYGIWFRSTPSGYSYALYKDGNGNGIRRQDILMKIDLAVTIEEMLGDRFPGVSFKVIAGDDIPGVPPDKTKLRSKDPLRISRSDIISFSPLGKSNGGTLYLSASQDRMAAVRIFGPTCRMRIWEYDAGRKEWNRWN